MDQRRAWWSPLAHRTPEHTQIYTNTQRRTPLATRQASFLLLLLLQVVATTRLKSVNFRFERPSPGGQWMRTTGEREGDLEGARARLARVTPQSLAQGSRFGPTTTTAGALNQSEPATTTTSSDRACDRLHLSAPLLLAGCLLSPFGLSA